MKPFGALFILVLTTFVYQKESKAQDSIVSTEHEYTFVEPLGFTLKTSEDFIKAFDLLSRNQFIATVKDESGNVRPFIAKGSFSREKVNLFCSYNALDKDEAEWQICLEAVINRYEIFRQQNDCIILSKREKSVAIYKVNCDQ